jgi:hypothetical protein
MPLLKITLGECPKMSGKITRKQIKAIPALFKHKTLEGAAGEIGVNERTLRRWLRDPLFRAELSQAEGEIIDGATRRLIALADLALDAIENVIENPAQRGASNKRLAAQAILDQLQKLRELRNLELRISDLEGWRQDEANNRNPS